MEDAGTQEIVQHEFAIYLQDTWTPNRSMTLNYGLRWEAQRQPSMITPKEDVFYAPFIGTAGFPSNGELTPDWGMFQPRLGLAWDIDGSGDRVFRANPGLYYARIPGLVLASSRTTNGSIGANLFSASFLNQFGITPPAYGELIQVNGQALTRPDVFVMDKDFSDPRTFSVTLGYEALINDDLEYSLAYNFADTRHLFRFINRNDAVFGSPFRNFPGDPTNGLGAVTVLESTAKSRYHGVTAGLRGDLNDRFEFDVNYTVSWDKSDDDNERDPFSFRFAQADRLDREYNYGDRDQRHRINGFLLDDLGSGFFMSSRISFYSS